jgi:selenocysteine lyase/cysteine desulfurase
VLPIAAPVFLSRLLASGGDRRIAVPAGGNANIYGASPFPRAVLGYAASTANDISAPAFAHLAEVVGAWPEGEALSGAEYAERLDQLRTRIRAAYALRPDVSIAFAPSGTDLEIFALSLVIARNRKPVRNILLGRDEIGSGCAAAAGGRYFAGSTALQPVVARNTLIAGLGRTEVVEIGVRDCQGVPQSSVGITAEIDRACVDARAAGRHALVHVVHGSKTGLVLPNLASIDVLRQRHGQAMSLVVDACQARLTGEAIDAYLARGAIVLLTGSKFIGGPPFSGIALVPGKLAPRAGLPAGLGTVLRRAELPADWPHLDAFDAGANPGLLLRLEAAVFELQRYASVPAACRNRVATAFAASVRTLADRLGVSLLTPSLEGAELHLATLATLDLSALPGAPDLATAQLWGKVLAARGIRLGQPVKVLPRADGQWAGTLRLSLSMPLIVALADLEPGDLARRFVSDMDRIADVLEAAQRRIAV